MIPPPLVKSRRRFGRTGSAYVFILGISLIVTVLAMGAAGVARVSARATAQANAWEAAGTLAFSATEQAMAQLNAQAAASPTTWRANYTSGQTAFTAAAGRGTMSWVLKDEFDGNLGDDNLEAFRLYGIGRVGSVTRVYSVLVVPCGTALDVMRTAVHSDAIITLAASAQAINGPFSSNTMAKLSGTLAGVIEAPATTGSPGGSPTILITPVKTMPSPANFNLLSTIATPITYAATGGNIKNVLLSAAVNPYGATNAYGIYRIAVPTGQNLTIEQSRIVGTLLISGVNKLTLKGPIEWEPGSANLPILVVSSPGIDMTVSGSPTWLSEAAAGTNFNPASTPFNGASDADLSDDFPPQYRGVMQIIGGASGKVTVNANAYIAGNLITDSPLTTGAQTTFVQNPAIAAAPPYGFGSGNALIELPGSWKWDCVP